MNNLQRIQNAFISDGTGLPATGASTTAVTVGKIGIFGTNMKALNPGGLVNTISDNPSIFIVEAKADGTLKRSFKINGAAVTKYEAESYVPAKRKVSAIGYNRLLAAGAITVVADTNYEFSVIFKNYKFLYSQRQETLRVNFTSALVATQLTIATQIAAGINNSAFKAQIKAVVVGNGTGVYGLTGATNHGVEIWALDVDMQLDSTFTISRPNFNVFVNDASGFGATPCGEVQGSQDGSGTFNQVKVIESYDAQFEGVINRRLWPIPDLGLSATSVLIASSAIVPTVTGTINEDQVTFSATVASMIRAGEKVTLGGVAYEIKFFISTTVAVLTTPLTASLAAATAIVNLKYDLINIEFNDAINTPTGVVAVANKSVIIAVPAINAGAAFNTLSTAGTNVKAILDFWMASTPMAFSGIAI